MSLFQLWGEAIFSFALKCFVVQNENSGKFILRICRQEQAWWQPWVFKQLTFKCHLRHLLSTALSSFFLRNTTEKPQSCFAGSAWKPAKITGPTTEIYCPQSGLCFSSLQSLLFKDQILNWSNQLNASTVNALFSFISEGRTSVDREN